MTFSHSQLAKSDASHWFCLKSQPKHEYIAATTLVQMMQIECFCPRIRFRKATKRGAVWFVEATFPGYFFARFNFAEQHRHVQSSPGVSTIVRFGESVAVVEDDAISRLKEAGRGQELIVFEPEIQIGDPVEIMEGAFQGLEAVVTQLLSAKERVKVLLNFLGREVEAEISKPKVLPSASAREHLKL